MTLKEGKASREMTNMLVKNATHTHKLLKALEKGDLYYRRVFDRKKMVKIIDLCEVSEIRS